MSVYYVHCIGINRNLVEREFHNPVDAIDFYEERKKESGYWERIEILKQMKVYLHDTKEEF